MSITDIIRDRAIANGVDPDVLVRFAQNESGLDPNAGSDTSSAKGLFGFTSGTAKTYGLSDPTDPVASSDAAARLMKDNATGLQSAGYDATPGNLYLSHFAGLGGARKVLAADPSASAGDVLGASVVAANPFLKGMSVADLRAWADRKGTPGSSAPTRPTAGILATAKPALGLLNSNDAEQASEAPDPQSIQNALNAMAQSQPRLVQPPTFSLDPIRYPSFDRARLLAALTRRTA